MSQPPDLKAIAQALCDAATLPGLTPKDVDKCESSRLKFICYAIAARLHDDPSALLAALGLQARLNRAETKLLVSEQDVTYWAERAERMEALARELLGKFTQKGHPGAPCHRTGWVDDEHLQALRDQLNEGSETPQ